MPHISPGERITVLGGSGFIGSHLIAALVAAGFDVVNYDLYPPVHPLPDGVTDLRGDIRDQRTLTTAITGSDAVVNLAAAHHDFGITDETFTSVNVDGAAIITAALTEAGIKNFCFYSSVAVYGESSTRPTEQTPPSPANIYGRTKLEAEAIYRRWQQEEPGRRALILRPAVVFGPRNAANMYRLIDQIARRRFLRVGKGHNEKSMIYVENIVQAILYLWRAEPQVEPEIVNCVDQPGMTSAQIIERVYRSLGRKPPRFHLPLRPAVLAAKPLDLVAKATKRNIPITSNRIAKLGAAETAFSGSLLHDMGFSAEVPLSVGIERMVRWYLENDHDPDYFTHIPPEKPVIA